MRKALFYFLVIVLVLSASLHVEALQDLWLASSGNNGDGSQSSPYTSVIDAINRFSAAAATDDVTLHILQGSYLWTGLSVTVVGRRDLAIVGEASVAPTLNCGYGNGLNFTADVNANVQVRVTNLAVTNCFPESPHGCLRFAGSPLGTGTMTATVDTVTVSDTYDQSTQSDGGAMLLSNSQFTISNSVFKTNYGYFGGAIEINGQAQGNNTIQSCVFDGNTATLNGGAIYIDMTTDNVFITNCTFINNAAPEGSAVYLATASPDTIITSSVFKYNKQGAVISAQASETGAAIVSRSKIVYNEFGVTTGVSGNVLNFTQDTIVWKNGGYDLDCSLGPGLSFAYAEQTPAVELCNRTQFCSGGQALIWDRCFVCGGSDDCLGCDGIPFSNNQACSPTTVGPIARDSRTLVQYTGTNPSAVLFPQDGGGGINSAHFLAVRFISLREVRQNGSAVVEHLFDTLPFDVSWEEIQVNATTVTSVIFQYYFSATGAGIVIRQTFYPAAQTLTQGAVSFDVDSQTLKISIELSNWPFEGGSSSTNAIELKIQAKTGEGLNALQVSTANLTTGGFTKQDVSFSTSHMQGGFGFLNFASFLRDPLAEASAIGNGTLEVIDFQRVANESDAKTATYLFRFPGYFKAMLYDPDFGVVVSSNHEGDGDADLGLIIGLSVGLPVAFIVVVGVIVVGTIIGCIAKKRMRALSGGREEVIVVYHVRLPVRSVI